jgi:hypothetical protein
MRRTTACFILLACAVTALPACGGSSSSGAPPVVPPGPVPTIDIVATSRDGDAIVMFKDILNNHPIVGADVVIDNTGPTAIDNNGRLAYENGWLAVASRDDDNVLIYGDAENLTSQQVPNAIVTTSGDARACCLSGGDLYVASGSEIRIWRDVTTVANADPADAVLTGFSRPSDCLVYMDSLFVVDRNANTLKRFDGAAALVGGEVPDVTLTYNEPRRMYIHEGTLWVMDDNDNSFVAGYDAPLAITPSSQPDQVIFGLIKTDGRRSMAFSGTTGWMVGRNPQDDVVINRIDLNDPTVAAAVIKRQDMPFEDAYDVKLIGGVLFFNSYDSSAVFWYLNPLAMVSGQAPDGFVFDARLNTGKMLTGWVR